MIPTEIILPPKDYDNLLAILKWEQAMPPVLNQYISDRFGEDMWNATRDHIPTELEDWEYISYVSQNGNGTGIIVVFGRDGEEADIDINVPVIRGE